MRKLGCAVAGLLVGAWPIAAGAQERPARDGQAAGQQAPPAVPEVAPDEEPNDIVVTGELRGAVQGDIPPEIQLSPADVRAYGVASIGDLLTELAPQTNSGRGRGGERPVVLLNGRRISSFAEIRDMPTEAIERVDILPEEVALKFGYSANQRVVNIVLRPRFRALTAEIEGRMPTAGGYSGTRGGIDLLKINRDGRINVDIKYNASSGLLESERDILPVGTAGLFDTRGNITGIASGEIDPALSALAGMPVTKVGVPAGGAAPTLASLVPGANIANVTDLSPYRTLISPSRQFTLNGTYTRTLSSKVSASFNASLDATQRTALLGLASETLTLPAGNPFSPFSTDVELHRYLGDLLPLSRDNKSLAAHAGISLNGEGTPWSGNWRWSFTSNYDRTTTRGITEVGVDPTAIQAALNANDPTVNPFGATPPGLIGIRPADYARSTASVGTADLLVNGPLFKVPAGDVSTSLRVSGTTSDFDSESLRSDANHVQVLREGRVARDSGSVRGNLDLPIASRRRAVLSAIGDLSLNGNIEVERLSDFGSLVTTGYGLNWSPITLIRFIASVTDEEGAPSASQLGDPVVSTPNVRVFDYARGETATITAITGGNPLLRADSRHVMKLGVNVRPLADKDLAFSADYVSSTTRDQISGFPAATAAVEAAFPDRFVRDAGGRLISIDNRGVNFARADRRQIRWGFNFSTPLGSTLEKRFQERRAQRDAQRAEAERNGTPLPPEGPPRQPGQERGQGAQGGGPPRPSGGFLGGGGGPRGFGPGGGGRGMGGPNGALAGRIQFSLYHTWHLKEQVKIRDGLPILDLLNGAATGNSGGQSAHEIEAQAGISKDGLGARLIGKWQSGTEVFTGLTNTDRLDFGGLATVNLRFFADMGRQISLVRKHRWLRGTRVTLAIDNLLDARQRVTDQTGAVPLSYQPDLLDPTGRVVRLSIRKLFF